jgi:hypothetical protein
MKGVAAAAQSVVDEAIQAAESAKPAPQAPVPPDAPKVVPPKTAE